MDRSAAASDDRFAHWPRLPARRLLAGLLALLIAAALVPIAGTGQETVSHSVGDNAVGAAAVPDAAEARDTDLQLYDNVIARIGRGENYYAAAAAEHRSIGFPLRPGVAMRLPTMAYIAMLLGPYSLIAAAFALMAAVLWAWWRRLSEEPGGLRYRRVGTALLFAGASFGLNIYYLVLHELWTGMLLALAFGLHRPGQRWGAALAVAALALAIREHALPFVLLFAAMAFWRRDWKEGAAWSALAAVFLAALAWHLALVAEQVLPSDRMGPGWMTLRGLPGWLTAVVASGNLRFLPNFIAGPLALLTIFGWASWRTSAGTTATLLQLGYGLAFMIAGRPENFYWGAVVAPTMLMGLVFVPRGVVSLMRAAR